jgi:hypothetical protein
MDLPHTQERATVGLVKQYSYESQEVISQLLGSVDKDQKFRYNVNRIENE